MSDQFFERPILNSPYAYPERHWELDETGQPTQQVVEARRLAGYYAPVPKARKQSGAQKKMVLDEGMGLSTEAQEYHIRNISALREQVDRWRALPNEADWRVTPETARLLKHWRTHEFSSIRPFFCQVEAVETVIWLTEVAPQMGRVGEGFLEHLARANRDANPEIMRLALKLATGAEVPIFRNLWEHIRKDMPKKGRGAAQGLDPLKLPMKLQTALEALYGHYEKIYRSWEDDGIRVPPCFIIVCNNTSTSKLVYDFVSGFIRTDENGSTNVENGRFELFRNFDEHDNPISRPRTLLIDSEQLESGEALDANFRSMAAPEIERFKRERRARRGSGEDDDPSDQELLREVMNTVGKPDTLGESIRCVVSVSMLTEGWDANTVTHVLGVRAFGTQLLCEQVIGRALRRQSYELNDDGLFDTEYADILGIPFDFTAKPQVVKPQRPRETIQVRAIRERDDLEIRFPRVAGYRVDLPREKITAAFTDDSILELNPTLVGPSTTYNSGIIGEGVDLNLDHLDDMRTSTLLMHLTKHLLYTKWRDASEDPKLYLFGQLKRIARQWLDTCLVCKGGTYPALLMYQALADMACERITAAITRSMIAEHPVQALLEPYNPAGSTIHVNFTTSKTERWETSSKSCHLNWVILDSDWEAEFCRVAEAHPRVRSYVKNHNLGFDVPYRFGSEQRKYRPDYIVCIDDGSGDDDLLNLVVEIKGFRGEDAKDKKSTMDTYWVPGVNNLGTQGRWAFAEFTDVYAIQSDFEARVEAEFNKMLDALGVPGPQRSPDV